MCVYLSNVYDNYREVLNADTALLDTIVLTLYRESKKENVEYRRSALKAFAMVLHELDIDRFTETYEIVQEILIKVSFIKYYKEIAINIHATYMCFIY